MIWLLPALAMNVCLQAEAVKPPLLEFLSASLTNGPGIQPMDGRVDPGFPYFSGGVAWRGEGKLTRSQIRLFLLDASGHGRARPRRLTLKAWEPADPLNPEQWRFKSTWPGGSAEGRKVRVVVLRRGRTWAQVEGPIREISLPAASPRPGNK